VKKNVGKSVIGNWKSKPVIGNFTGNRLTGNRLTTLQKSLRLCSFKSDRGEICYSSEYASTDGVRFIIWHHTCKMASTMSFHEKA